MVSQPGRPKNGYFNSKNLKFLKMLCQAYAAVHSDQLANKDILRTPLAFDSICLPDTTVQKRISSNPISVTQCQIISGFCPLRSTKFETEICLPCQLIRECIFHAIRSYRKCADKISRGLIESCNYFHLRNHIRNCRN